MTKYEIRDYNTRQLELMKEFRTKAFACLMNGDSEGFKSYMDNYDKVEFISFKEATDL